MHAVEQTPISRSTNLHKNWQAQPPAFQQDTGSGFSLSKILGFSGAGLAAGGLLGAAAKVIGFKLPLIGSVTGLAGIAKIAGIGAGAGLAVAAAPALLELAQKNPLAGNIAIGGALGAAAGVVIPVINPLFGGIIGAAAGAALHFITGSDNRHPGYNPGLPPRHGYIPRQGPHDGPPNIGPPPGMPGFNPRHPGFGNPQTMIPRGAIMTPTPYGPVMTKPRVSLMDRLKYAFTGVPPVQYAGYGGMMPAYAGQGMIPPFMQGQDLGKDSPIQATRTIVNEDGTITTVPLTDEELAKITKNIESIVHGIIPKKADDVKQDVAPEPDVADGNGTVPPVSDTTVAAPDDKDDDQQEKPPTQIDLSSIPMDDAPEGESMQGTAPSPADSGITTDAGDLPAPPSASQ